MTGESDALVTHGHGHKILLFHNKKKAFTNHSISSSLKFYSFTTGKLCLLYRTSRGPSASKMLNIMPYTRRCWLLINRLWIVSPRPTGPVFSPWVCHWSITKEWPQMGEEGPESQVAPMHLAWRDLQRGLGNCGHRGWGETGDGGVLEAKERRRFKEKMVVVLMQLLGPARTVQLFCSFFSLAVLRSGVGTQSCLPEWVLNS